MIAKVLLLCAAVATAQATGGFVYPGLYGSGILAPGLLNTVVAPGLHYGGASILSAAAIPTSYTTTRTVVSAPAAIAAPVAVAAPVSYAKTVVAAPVSYAKTVVAAAPAPAVAVAAPVSYARTVVAAPAAVSAPLAVAAPVAYSKTYSVAAPAAINTYSTRTVIGANSLLTGTPLIYGNGILANRLVAAAAPLGYSTGVVGVAQGINKGTPFVSTILKK